MELYKNYKLAFPDKTDAQCIESLCWEVKDKVETIYKLLSTVKEFEELKKEVCTWNKVDMGMMGCPDYVYRTSCKTEVDATSNNKTKFCPNCGKPVI